VPPLSSITRLTATEAAMVDVVVDVVAGRREFGRLKILGWSSTLFFGRKDELVVLIAET